MNQITDPPIHSQAGLDFNYEAWSPNTVLTLCNVNWGYDYQDVVKFENRTKLDEYIDTYATGKLQFDDSTYAPVSMPIRLDYPFNKLYKNNYVRVHNPAQPVMHGDVPRSFYYFITDVRYIAPNTTEIQVQLDVFQTFVYEMTFGNAFIERGHIGIANENDMAGYGRDYLTVVEGLDVGGEYNIVDRWSKKLASARGRTTTEGNYSPEYDIMVVSNTILTNPPETTQGKPQLNTATGSPMQNLPNGSSVTIFKSVETFNRFLLKYSQFPWITQGIMGVYAIPSWEENFGDVSMQEYDLSDGDGEPLLAFRPMAGSFANKRVSFKENWRLTAMDNIPDRYRYLHKFLTYPYCLIEMTTNTGSPLMIKPESWNDPDATFVQFSHLAQPGPRIMFSPLGYNKKNNINEWDELLGQGYDGGEFLDFATGITDFPTFSVVNNSYVSFMASNRAGLNYQHQSADWGQQKAMTGNQLAFDQSTSAIGSSYASTQIGMDTANSMNNVNNVGAMYGGASQILTGGGSTGVSIGMNALGSIANTGMTIATNNARTAISNNAAAGMQEVSAEQARTIRDTNKSYADYGTKGDYQNAIGAITAKTQDAKLIQPTTSGQVGGDAFLLANYQWGVEARVKMLQGAAMANIGEHWLRYGYAVHRRVTSLPASLNVCSHFTYWKLQEVYITSASCPELYKRTMMGIFEKGVTVWDWPGDIGTIDIGVNVPDSGVYL